MADSKTEVRQVSIMIFICAVTMLIPFLVWWPQTQINAKNFFFVLVDIILTVAFFYMCRVCIKDAKEHETETNAKRAFTILLAVVEFIWVAGWAAYQNELVK